MINSVITHIPLHIPFLLCFLVVFLLGKKKFLKIKFVIRSHIFEFLCSSTLLLLATVQQYFFFLSLLCVYSLMWLIPQTQIQR